MPRVTRSPRRLLTVAFISSLLAWSFAAPVAAAPAAESEF